jgi:hypothetical protein
VRLAEVPKTDTHTVWGVFTDCGWIIAPLTRDALLVFGSYIVPAVFRRFGFHFVLSSPVIFGRSRRTLRDGPKAVSTMRPNPHGD